MPQESIVAKALAGVVVFVLVASVLVPCSFLKGIPGAIARGLLRVIAIVPVGISALCIVAALLPRTPNTQYPVPRETLWIGAAVAAAIAYPILYFGNRRKGS